MQPTNTESLDQASHNTKKSSNGKTPLHRAASAGNIDLMQQLINNGIDPAITDSIGQTPLHSAASSGNIAAIKFLIDKSPQIIDKADNSKRTALHLAAINGESEAIEYLLASGANINSQDTDGCQPIYYAVTSNDSNSIKHLINPGSGLNGIRNLLSKSKNSTKEEIIKGLVRTKSLEPKLQKLLDLGDIESIYSMMEVKINLFKFDDSYNIALLMAAELDNLKAIDALIRIGVDVDFKNILNNRAIHQAITRDNIEALKLLISHGAGIEYEDGDNDKPIHLAIKGKNIEILRFLIDSGAEVNAVHNNKSDSNNYSYPIHLAARTKKPEIIKLLIDAKANLRITDNKRYSAIHYLTNGASIEAVKLLIDHGNNIDERGRNDRTPLMRAAEIGCANDIKIFVQLGAQIEAKDDNDDTALMRAAQFGKPDQIKTLIDLGANINVRNRDNNSALHYAACNKNLESLKIIWEQLKQEIDITSNNNHTAISYSAINGKINNLKFLIEKGADISKEYEVNFSSNRLSIFDILSKKGFLNNDFIEYLFSHNISMAHFNFRSDLVKCFDLLDKCPNGVFNNLANTNYIDDVFKNLRNSITAIAQIYQIDLSGNNNLSENIAGEIEFILTVNKLCRSIRPGDNFDKNHHIYELYQLVADNLLNDLDERKYYIIYRMVSKRSDEEIKQSNIFKNTQNLILNKYLDLESFKAKSEDGRLTNKDLEQFSLDEEEFEELVDSRMNYLLQSAQYDELIKLTLNRKQDFKIDEENSNVKFIEDLQSRPTSIAITPMISRLEGSGQIQNLQGLIDHILQMSPENEIGKFASETLKPLIERNKSRLEKNINQEVEFLITDITEKIELDNKKRPAEDQPLPNLRPKKLHKTTYTESHL